MNVREQYMYDLKEALAELIFETCHVRLCIFHHESCIIFRRFPFSDLLMILVKLHVKIS